MGIGITRFIIVIRIDNLTNYSKNHFEILDPSDVIAKKLTAKQLGSLSHPDGGYNYFILNKELKLLSIKPNFMPERNQFIILLNKNITWPTMGSGLSVINRRLINYIKNSIIKNFLVTVEQSAYQNINEGSDFLLDPLPK